MRSIVLNLLLLSLITQGDSLAQNLVVNSNGDKMGDYSIDDLSAIVKPIEISIYEPHEHRNRTYTGFSARDLLKHFYKRDLSADKEIYITCTDGYKPAIPVSKFLKYDGYFVYKSGDENDFTLINKNQNDEFIDLKQFYLIWDNIKYPDLQKTGAYDFPYQIESIDLISFEKSFPLMSPPAGSKEKVNSGFIAFRKYCSTCHTINGEGGTKGVELNYPVNVTEYFKSDWLKKWISDPGSIRYSTKMPVFGPELANRDEVIDEIIEYLKAMRSKKIKPDRN